MTTCPQCHGEKVLRAAFRPIQMECDICNGMGVVCDEKLKWIATGKAMRDHRLNTLRLTLRSAAHTFNRDVVTLSKMERGVIEPQPELYPKEQPAPP